MAISNRKKRQVSAGSGRFSSSSVSATVIGDEKTSGSSSTVALMAHMMRHQDEFSVLFDGFNEAKGSDYQAKIMEITRKLYDRKDVQTLLTTAFNQRSMQGEGLVGEQKFPHMGKETNYFFSYLHGTKFNFLIAKDAKERISLEALGHNPTVIVVNKKVYIIKDKKYITGASGKPEAFVILPPALWEVISQIPKGLFPLDEDPHGEIYRQNAPFMDIVKYIAADALYKAGLAPCRLRFSAQELIERCRGSIHSPLLDVLEVGVGEGVFLQAANKMVGVKCKGITVDNVWKQRGELVPPGIEIKDVFALSELNKYDVVLGWRVATHIPDTCGLLNKLISLTKPGGYIVLDSLRLAGMSSLQARQIIVGLKLDGHTVAGLCGENVLDKEGAILSFILCKNPAAPLVDFDRYLRSSPTSMVTFEVEEEEVIALLNSIRRPEAAVAKTREFKAEPVTTELATADEVKQDNNSDPLVARFVAKRLITIAGTLVGSFGGPLGTIAGTVAGELLGEPILQVASKLPSCRNRR